LSTGDCIRYILPDTNGSSGSVDQPSSLFHFGNEFLVEQTFCTFVQWGILVISILSQEGVRRRTMVTTSHWETISSRLSTLRALIPFLASTISSIRTLTKKFTLGKISVVVPQQLFTAERLQPLQHPITNSTTTNSTNHLVLEIKGISSNVGYVPLAGPGLIMGGDKVSYKDEDGHDDVFSD
jgi:hypothetical protein